MHSSCSVQSLILLMLYAMSNLSLAAEVTYITVFPGFWMIDPMILEQVLQMTSTVAYIDCPAMQVNAL